MHLVDEAVGGGLGRGQVKITLHVGLDLDQRLAAQFGEFRLHLGVVLHHLHVRHTRGAYSVWQRRETDMRSIGRGSGRGSDGHLKADTSTLAVCATLVRERKGARWGGRTPR